MADRLDVVSDFVRKQISTSYKNTFVDQNGFVSIKVFNSFLDTCIGIVTEKKKQGASSSNDLANALDSMNIQE
jgi:hypothetical protein